MHKITTEDILLIYPHSPDEKLLLSVSNDKDPLSNFFSTRLCVCFLDANSLCAASWMWNLAQ
jgi:hypothetical protein